MEVIILVSHLLIAVALIATVLLQRSEGGALGMGGGGAGGGGLMTGRGAANVLTRATAILAGCFMATSITLAILASSGGQSGSIVDESAPAAEAPAGEDAPGTPSAPER